MKATDSKTPAFACCGNSMLLTFEKLTTKTIEYAVE